MKRINQSGFSLFELVVIIAVLAIVGLGGWNIYQRSHRRTGEVSTTKVTKTLSSLPVITSSADLDKASQTLDQTVTDSSSDTAQLDNDLASF